jgi:hypothetical protein
MDMVHLVVSEHKLVKSAVRRENPIRNSDERKTGRKFLFPALFTTASMNDKRLASIQPFPEGSTSLK